LATGGARTDEDNPELAFEEHRACALLTDTLEGAGLGVSRGAYGLATAFECEFDGGSASPRVTLLAEYDTHCPASVMPVATT
jgi:metal-dependent amidase/aminoacylase/carboxypeptidase family protein